ncbi:hypothetical protein JOF29_000046 [Kribbella aluminosa]|uniref:ATP-grasp target RiPP n=1 Tax=Kribbella aluminosa TaxID=416017 RepID=A0ABS4UBH3_9ACTN|nr:hypothetical protein [Kribbella aluminosa]MBP2348963.1 hypothetical protein [Kribbella aluminosa]
MTQVVLAIPIPDPGFQPPLEGITWPAISAATSSSTTGDPGAEMVRVEDDLADQAIRVAGDRSDWPERDVWEEGTDPRRMPGLYDDYPEDDAEGEDPAVQGH